MQANHNERRAITFALCAVLLWSTVATGFKLGLALMSVVQLLMLGTLISWAVFALYCCWTRRWRLAPGEASLALWLGLLNPLTYYLVLFAAYDRLPAYIAQPLNYTWAFTLALLSVPLLKQSLSTRLLQGMLVSYAGVVWLLVNASANSDTPISLVGVFLALLSTVLWASYWLVSTRATSDPGAMMFWSFSAAAPAIALICALTSGWPAFTPENWLYGAWVGAIEMGITFLLWQHALKATSRAARLGQLIFLSPFASLLLIYWVLGEPVTISAIAALGVIVAGLWYAQASEPAS